MRNVKWKCPSWVEPYRRLLLGVLPDGALEQVMRGNDSLDGLPVEFRRVVMAIVVMAKCELLDSLHSMGALGRPVCEGDELLFLGGPFAGKLKSVPQGATHHEVIEPVDEPAMFSMNKTKISYKRGSYRLERLVLDGKTASVMAWEGWS